MTRNFEARITRLEEAATGGERIQVRSLNEAPVHLRQTQSFLQPAVHGRVILWLDGQDARA